MTMIQSTYTKIRKFLFGEGEPICPHEQHALVGHETLRSEHIFYEVFDRPNGDDPYWSETDGTFVLLQMYELQYVCTVCGKRFELQTPERVGGPDGIIRKVDGRPDEAVTSGGWRKGWHWYGEYEEEIESKYHDVSGGDGGESDA